MRFSRELFLGIWLNKDILATFLWFYLILTWNGPQVEIISDHLLQFMVNWSFLKLKTQVMSQIFINDFAYNNTKKNTRQNK